MIIWFLVILKILKIKECNSTEATKVYLNLSYQIKLRLTEINKIKDYFNLEIQENKQLVKS